MHDRVDGRLEVVVLRLGEEPDVAQVDPQHRGACPLGELGGAQDGAVAADDQRPARSRRSRASAPVISTPVAGRVELEVAGLLRPSSRTTMPLAVSALPKARATSRASSRPVWATSRTRRSRRARGWSRVHLLTRDPRRVGARDGAVDVVVRDGRRPRRSQRKNSTLPDGPGSGLVATLRAPQPFRAAAAATPRTASARCSGSRTTPPLPTRSLPTSNCGLTISARSPSGATTPSSASSTSASEMKDRSPTTTSTGPPISSGVSSRTFVRSCTTTRSSCRRRQASWP